MYICMSIYVHTYVYCICSPCVFLYIIYKGGGWGCKQIIIRKVSDRSMRRTLSAVAYSRLVLQELELLAIEKRLAAGIPPDVCECVPIWDETSEALPMSVMDRTIRTTVDVFVRLPDLLTLIV